VSVSANYTTTDTAFHWHTFTMTHAGPTIITPAMNLRLRITNVGGNTNNRDIEVASNGDGSACGGMASGASSSASHVVLDASTVINVDSVQVYNAASPSGVLLTKAVENSTVYVRSIISDPFGSADINNNTVVEVFDNTSALVVGPINDPAILNTTVGT